MNVPEYIKLAKRILKEDAGSEGMVYEVAAKSGLKAIEHDLFKIEEDKHDLEYTVRVKTKADLKKAIKRSIMLIDGIPEFKDYLVDLNNALDTLETM